MIKSIVLFLGLGYHDGFQIKISKGVDMAQSKAFVKWKEAIRRRLKDVKILGKVLKLHFEYADGQARFQCPLEKRKFSILDVSEGSFLCECGHKSRGDVFSLVMHLTGSSFGKTISKLSGATRILTPVQQRKNLAKKTEKRKSG